MLFKLKWKLIHLIFLNVRLDQKNMVSAGVTLVK